MDYSTINFIFIVLFVGSTLFFWYQTRLLKSKSKKSLKEPIDSQESDPFSLVSIAVPRNNERTPQAAEQMFAALHGIFRSGADTQPQISLEIATKNQSILFYVHMPTELKDFVLSQIYAQYPNVEIKDVLPEDDYVQVREDRGVAATELTFKKPGPYPIKTFLNFEVDPLSGITGVLSSVGANEDMWFQMVVRPIDDDWQDQGDKEIEKIKDPPKSSKSILEIVTEKTVLFVTDFLRAIVTGSIAEAEKKEEKKDKKELTGSQQQAVKGIEEKITKLGYETTIRLVATHQDPSFARARLEQLVGAFKQYNSLSLNSFVSKEITDDPAAIELYRRRAIGAPEMIFNITELASLYHFPSDTVATPLITWSGSKKGEPPGNLPLAGTVPADELTVFAQTDYRARVEKFGIKRKDRRLHMYIIGKTGTGKSTLMENMIFDDINEGRGVAVVDPHGELIDHILDFIPENRIDDVIYFSPADYNFPIGFNILETVNPEMRNVVASGVVGIFKKIFGESWGPRLEYILRNAVLALLEYPNSTLLGIMRILTDNAYRRQVINDVKDPVVKDFFINEFEKYEPKFRQEAIAPIQNKVGQFTSSSTIRNIVGQPKSAMDILQVMDSGKILLADLSTGKIGEDNSALLGAMLITKIQLAAMSRTNMLEEDRRDFYLYVDEFQNFATDSFATILSEARKYRLNLVMINQYINQMPETVANAVFGNVGTMISFRVGAGDAEALKNEFQPVFDVNDLVNLPNRQIYLKMAIDGVTVPAFSASTLPPPAEKANLRQQVIDRSRQHYATARADVEDYIADWSAPINLSLEADAKSRPPRQDWEKIVTKPLEAKEGSQPTIKEEGTGPENSGVPPVPPQTTVPVTPEPERGVLLETPPAPSHSIDREPLAGHKIQMVNDRFNRKWYAVGPRQDQPSHSENPPVSGGVTPEKREEELLELPKHLFPPAVESQLTPKNPDHQPGSGGVGEPKDETPHLITWEKADELGLQLPNRQVNPKPQNSEFLPIDEL